MNMSYRFDFSQDSYSLQNSMDSVAEALPFRVDGGGMYDCGDKYFTERYGLNSYLLLYTLSGNGEIDTGDGKKILSGGQAVVFNCMPWHYYGTVKGQRWKFFYCHFQGNMDGFVPMLPKGGQGTEVLDPKEFSALFEKLLGVIRAGEVTCGLMCNDLITQLLTKLALMHYSSGADANLHRHISALDTLRAYLQENYAQSISLDDMALRMHMSKYHFARLFQAYAHMSPYAYLTDLRINAAREMLHMSDASVREIAEQVGFGDSNTFIRLFKKRCGVTPAKYRQMWHGA